jgi:hypothetical protein
MARLELQTVLLYGDDRGSVMPVNLYEVDLPKADHAAYLDALNGDYQVLLENIVSGEVGHRRFFWIEDADEYLDETEQMLRRDRYPANEDAWALPTDPRQAINKILSDTLTSDTWEGTFGEEDAVRGKSVLELVEIAHTPKPVKVETPKRIPLGTRVYRIDTRNFYIAATGPFTFEGSKSGPEEEYVPVDFVKQHTVEVEAFPLPAAISKHNRWFARTKQGKKFESAGRLRADAIQKVKFKAAHADFWK